MHTVNLLANARAFFEFMHPLSRCIILSKLWRFSNVFVQPASQIELPLNIAKPVAEKLCHMEKQMITFKLKSSLLKMSRKQSSQIRDLSLSLPQIHMVFPKFCLSLQSAIRTGGAKRCRPVHFSLRAIAHQMTAEKRRVQSMTSKTVAGNPQIRLHLVFKNLQNCDFWLAGGAEVSVFSLACEKLYQKSSAFSPQAKGCAALRNFERHLPNLDLGLWFCLHCASIISSFRLFILNVGSLAIFDRPFDVYNRSLSNYEAGFYILGKVISIASIDIHAPRPTA